MPSLTASGSKTCAMTKPMYRPTMWKGELMVDAELPAVPTAHASATLSAAYPDAEGDLMRAPTAHVSAVLSATEPGP